MSHVLYIGNIDTLLDDAEKRNFAFTFHDFICHMRPRMIYHKIYHDVICCMCLRIIFYKIYHDVICNVRTKRYILTFVMLVSFFALCLAKADCVRLCELHWFVCQILSECIFLLYTCINCKYFQNIFFSGMQHCYLFLTSSIKDIISAIWLLN